MLLFPSSSLFIIIIVFLSLLLFSSAQLCDVGDLSSICIVSSPKSFNESQSFSGTNFIISSNITCPGCSLEFVATKNFSVSVGHIEAFNLTVISENSEIEATSLINVEINGTLLFRAVELTVYGRIEGTYLKVEITNKLDLYGRISANGYGYESGIGPGRGANGAIGQSGGGAGYGANGCGTSAGTSYGTTVNPTDLGSGGGFSNDYRVVGGTGGGFVYISAILLVINANSTISSNGNPGGDGISDYYYGAGGGSGGSIHIRTGQIAFYGSITANGGRGGTAFGTWGTPGGGGAGGRIYINSTIPLAYVANRQITVNAGCLVYAFSGEMGAFCSAGYEPYLYACRGCNSGEYSPDGNLCLDCPRGTFSNSTLGTNISECMPCPPGTYGQYPGASSCSPCFIGYFTNSSGKSDCNICPTGTIAPERGSSNCTQCAGGTYAYDRRDCYNCEAGSISAPGSVSCTKCLPGSVPVNSTCTMCTPNTYSYISTCVNCSAGRYSSSNSPNCTYCPRGTYGSHSGSGCLQCSPGYNSPSSGATSCTACSAGSYSNVSGSSSCLYCAQNTYSDTASISCTPCPEGQQSSPGARRCSLKPQTSTGAYSYSTTSSDPNVIGGVNFKALSIALPLAIIAFVGIFLLIIFIAVRKSNKNAYQPKRPQQVYIPPTNSNETENYTINIADVLGVPKKEKNVEKDKLKKKGDDVEVEMGIPKKSKDMEGEELKSQKKNAELENYYNAPSSSSSSSTYTTTEPSAPPAAFENEFPPPQNPDYAPEPSAPSISSTNVNQNSDCGNGVCVVCYERGKQIVFLPCGHVATCDSCATKITSSDPVPKCPICRTPVKSTTRVYL